MKSYIGGKWRTGPSMNTWTYNCGVALVNNKIYYVGGHDEPGSRIDSVSIYDTDSEIWSYGNSLPTPLVYCSCASIGKKIYCVGGRYTQSNYVDTLYIYDTETNMWSAGASMSTARILTGVVAVGNFIYAIGGTTKQGKTNLVEVYDINSDLWRVASPMPLEINTFGCNQINGKIYITGGEYTTEQGITTQINHMYIYDPIADNWTEGPEMLLGRSYHGSCVIDSNLYEVGNNGNGSSVEVFKVTDQKWFVGVDFPGTNSWHMSCVSNNNQIYVIDGRRKIFYIFTLGDECVIRQEYVTDMGTMIQAPNGQAADDGESLTLNAPAIEGYEYLGYRINGGPLQPGDTVQLDNILQDYTITYIYSKSLTITKQYRRANGTTVVQADQLEAIAEGSDFIGVAPKIGGYVRIGHKVDGGALSTSLTAIIQDVREDHTVTYLYDAGDEDGDNEVTITHQYQLEDGSQLLPDDTGIAILGDPYVKTAPSIDGYQLVGWQVDGGALQIGTYARIDDVTAAHFIIFIYEPDDDQSATMKLHILLKVQEQVNLIATLLPSNIEPSAVIWSSADPAIASVDANGVVTGLSVGITQITVRTTDGTWEASAMVKVIDDEEDEEFRLSILLAPDETCRLIAVFDPENSILSVTWHSSNPAVASVDQRGEVTAHTEGVTLITVTDGTNTDQIYVTVRI